MDYTSKVICMKTNQIIAIAVVAVIAVAAVALFAMLPGGEKGGNDEPTGDTVVDSAGRTVAIPENLDDGIVTVGWGILKVLSYYDARENVTQVDYQEAQAMFGSLQSHYYCYDMSKMGTHEDSTMGNFSESTIESIAKEKPSLVIMRTGIYEKYKVGCDALAKACTLVVLDLNDLDSNFFQQNGDGKLAVADDLRHSIEILGKVLKESNRSSEVLSILDATLADITAHRYTGDKILANLSGSQMGMSSGDINVVFPYFNPFVLAGVSNAASEAGYAAPPWFAEISVEDFTSKYAFDAIFYDPSAPNRIDLPNNQSVLRWLYEQQGTGNEKEIYVLMTTALCGYDMLSVIADAYYVEAVTGTIAMSEFQSKMTGLYCDLYGEKVGSSLMENLCKVYSARGAAFGVCTDMWSQVKVGIVDGKYTFVAA